MTQTITAWPDLIGLFTNNKITACYKSSITAADDYQLIPFLPTLYTETHCQDWNKWNFYG
jgi:hypothetical protein